MKSITNKFLGILSALCLCMGWSACTDEVEYTGAALQDATQAYFPTNLPSQIDLKAEATTFNVEVSRMEAGQELTVNLTKSDDKDALFTVPSTVTFAADATTATISIGYDPAKFKLDEYMPLTISIESDKANPYSSASYSFTAGVPAPYNTIGMVNFRDTYLAIYSFTPKTYKVELQENSVTKGLYRLVNPYQENPYTASGIYDSSKTYYLTIDATDKDCVYIPSNQPLGVKFGGDGMMYAYSYAGYLMDNGKSKEEVKAQGLFGKLENNLITFPIDALLVTFDGDKNLYYSNRTGDFALAVDTKTEIKDYNLSAECSNVSVGIDGSTSIIGKVEWGADIAYTRLAVIEARMVNDAVGDVLNGSLESIKQTQEGTFNVPFDATGKLSVLVIGFDSQDNAQNVTVTGFTYKTGDPLILPAKIDDYVGTWAVPVYNGNDFLGNQSVSINKKDESTLVINGLYALYEGYDDSVELVYNTETGYVEFGYAELPGYNTQTGLINPVFLAIGAGSNLSGSSVLVGGFTESGALQFVNKIGNELVGDYFAIFGVNKDNKLMALSYDYGFDWLPIPATATTKSIRASNNISAIQFCETNREMVKKSKLAKVPSGLSLPSMGK